MIPRYDFASDNTAGIAPEALEALLAANAGARAGYGADDVCQRAADRIRALLDVDAEVRFVASGTAANAVSLAALCRPFEAVLAHADAHVTTDETGAPGFFGHGLAVGGLSGDHARIEPDSLSGALAGADSPHRQSPAALSLTQSTEYGAVYADDAFLGLAGLAKAAGLGLHVDGARFANAVAAGFDPKCVARSGADILVLGGAKAGLSPTEALVVIDPRLAPRLGARLKQSGQLVSKGRFLAAPWVGALESGAFLSRAAHANAMAARLAKIQPFPIRHPVESNAVFVDMPEAAHARLTARGWTTYRCPDGSVRFMCAWSTDAETLDAFAEDLRAVA